MITSDIRSLVRNLAYQKTVSLDTPSFGEVRSYLASCFPGAELHASAFFNTMTEQHWHDQNRRPITNWHAMAKAYASKAHMRHA
jgi:hypothetical protein